jgi:beta-lactamase class A
MVGVSDNSATNILAGRLGLEKINTTLESLGLKQTRFRRKMFDTDGARKGLENTATPRELVHLLAAVHDGKVLSKDATIDFWKMLGTFKSGFLEKALPDNVRVATKPGWIEQVRVDAGVIFARNRPFAIAVMGSYLRDGRAAERQIANIALVAYQYFEIVGLSTDLGRRVP